MSGPSRQVQKTFTTVRPKTTTDDTPDFDRNKVQLDVPDELFGNSFTLVTNISKLAGDFIMVSYWFYFLTYRALSTPIHTPIHTHIHILPYAHLHLLILSLF